MIELPIITLLLMYFLVFYIVTTILYATKNKWYYENIKKLNPMMYVENYSYGKGLAIMIATTIILAITFIGLCFFVYMLWPIIILFILSANEVYRGATYYIEAGDYGESVKHMIVHGMVMGYLLSWFVFAILPGLLPAWLLTFIF